MKELVAYIKEKNRFNAIFFPKVEAPFPVVPETLTNDQALDLWNQVDCELSPENVSCDGEADSRYVRQRVAYLTTVRQQIESLNKV